MSIGAASLTYKYGKPIMVKGVLASGSSWNAGDVIVKGQLPFVAHTDNPAFTGATQADALAARGGVYTGRADAAYKVGTYVYWDITNSKFTAKSAANAVPFGYIVGGVNGEVYDGGSTADGDAVDVLHEPTAPTGVVYSFGSGTAADTVTNTNTKTGFATTATIPAGTLQAGDVVKVRTAAVVTAQNSTNTHAVATEITTSLNTYTALANTGAVNAAANTPAVQELTLLFTAVGNSGAFLTIGTQGFNAPPNTVFLANTAINTSIDVTIRAAATASAASTGNVIQLVELDASLRKK